MMEWSEEECLNDMVTSENAATVSDVEELLLLMKHAMMQAFSSSAFMPWTRCATRLY